MTLFGDCIKLIFHWDNCRFTCNFKKQYPKSSRFPQWERVEKKLVSCCIPTSILTVIELTGLVQTSFTSCTHAQYTCMYLGLRVHVFFMCVLLFSVYVCMYLVLCVSKHVTCVCVFIKRVATSTVHSTDLSQESCCPLITMLASFSFLALYPSIPNPCNP